VSARRAVCCCCRGVLLAGGQVHARLQRLHSIQPDGCQCATAFLVVARAGWLHPADSFLCPGEPGTMLICTSLAGDGKGCVCGHRALTPRPAAAAQAVVVCAGATDAAQEAALVGGLAAAARADGRRSVFLYVSQPPAQARPRAGPQGIPDRVAARWD